MQYLLRLENAVRPICILLEGFIAEKLGFGVEVQQYCSFVTRFEDFKYQFIFALISVLVVLLVLVVSLLKGGKKGVKSFQAKLVDIKEISHDTKIFTFALPDGKNKIGLNIGEHLELEAEIEGKTVARKYTPISRADLKRNSFELLIKVYFKQPPQWPNGGLMSQHVNSLKLGETIKVTLPFGRFNYLGKSQVQIKEPNGSIRRQKVDHIYMVGGGTGITPLYQIVQYVTEAEKASQRPNLTLLFANRTEDDILVKPQLDSFQKDNQTFRCFYSVDRSIKEGWKGFVGYIDEEKISKIVAEGSLDKSLFVVCGPPVLCNIVEKEMTTKFKVKPEQFFRF